MVHSRNRWTKQEASEKSRIYANNLQGKDRESPSFGNQGEEDVPIKVFNF
jgi:hypothetical protein